MNPLRRNAPPRPRGGGSRGVRRGAGARVGFPWLMPASGLEEMLNLVRHRRGGDARSLLPDLDHLISYFMEVLSLERNHYLKQLICHISVVL